MPQPEWRTRDLNWQAIRLTSAAFVLCYGLVLVIGSAAGFPEQLRTGRLMPYLADKPLQEDSFYMLTVAWNAGMGEGLAYNQHQPTVGVQSLDTFVAAALAWAVRSAGGTRWTFARAVLGMGVLSLLLFSAVTAGIAGRLADAPGIAADHPATIAAVLTLANFGLFR